MTNSGISALHISCLLMNVKPGDEVLVPALSWPTTIWPIIQLGLKPVIVDVNLKSLAIEDIRVETKPCVASSLSVQLISN